MKQMSLQTTASGSSKNQSNQTLSTQFVDEENTSSRSEEKRQHPREKQSESQSQLRERKENWRYALPPHCINKFCSGSKLSNKQFVESSQQTIPTQKENEKHSSTKESFQTKEDRKQCVTPTEQIITITSNEQTKERVPSANHLLSPCPNLLSQSENASDSLGNGPREENLLGENRQKDTTSIHSIVNTKSEQRKILGNDNKHSPKVSQECITVSHQYPVEKKQAKSVVHIRPEESKTNFESRSIPLTRKNGEQEHKAIYLQTQSQSFSKTKQQRTDIHQTRPLLTHANVGHNCRETRKSSISDIPANPGSPVSQTANNLWTETTANSWNTSDKNPREAKHHFSNTAIDRNVQPPDSTCAQPHDSNHRHRDNNVPMYDQIQLEETNQSHNPRGCISFQGETPLSHPGEEPEQYSGYETIPSSARNYQDGVRYIPISTTPPTDSQERLLKMQSVVLGILPQPYPESHTEHPRHISDNQQPHGEVISERYREHLMSENPPLAQQSCFTDRRNTKPKLSRTLGDPQKVEAGKRVKKYVLLLKRPSSTRLVTSKMRVSEQILPQVESYGKYQEPRRPFEDCIHENNVDYRSGLYFPPSTPLKGRTSRCTAASNMEILNPERIPQSSRSLLMQCYSEVTCRIKQQFSRGCTLKQNKIPYYGGSDRYNAFAHNMRSASKYSNRPQCYSEKERNYSHTPGSYFQPPIIYKQVESYDQPQRSYYKAFRTNFQAADGYNQEEVNNSQPVGSYFETIGSFSQPFGGYPQPDLTPINSTQHVLHPVETNKRGKSRIKKRPARRKCSPQVLKQEEPEYVFEYIDFPSRGSESNQKLNRKSFGGPRSTNRQSKERSPATEQRKSTRETIHEPQRAPSVLFIYGREYRPVDDLPIIHTPKPLIRKNRKITHRRKGSLQRQERKTSDNKVPESKSTSIEEKEKDLPCDKRIQEDQNRTLQLGESEAKPTDGKSNNSQWYVDECGFLEEVSQPVVGGKPHKANRRPKQAHKSSQYEPPYENRGRVFYDNDPRHCYHSRDPRNAYGWDPYDRLDYGGSYGRHTYTPSPYYIDRYNRSARSTYIREYQPCDSDCSPYGYFAWEWESRDPNGNYRRGPEQERYIAPHDWEQTPHHDTIMTELEEYSMISTAEEKPPAQGGADTPQGSEKPSLSQDNHNNETSTLGKLDESSVEPMQSHVEQQQLGAAQDVDNGGMVNGAHDKTK